MTKFDSSTFTDPLVFVRDPGALAPKRPDTPGQLVRITAWGWGVPQYRVGQIGITRRTLTKNVEVECPDGTLVRGRPQCFSRVQLASEKRAAS